MNQYLDTLDSMPALKVLVERILSKNLIPTNINEYAVQGLEIFSQQKQALYAAALRKQLVHHNLEVFAAFYKEINVARMSQMIQVEV